MFLGVSDNDVAGSNECVVSVFLQYTVGRVQRLGGAWFGGGFAVQCGTGVETWG